MQIAIFGACVTGKSPVCTMLRLSLPLARIVRTRTMPDDNSNNNGTTNLYRSTTFLRRLFQLEKSLSFVMFMAIVVYYRAVDPREIVKSKGISFSTRYLQRDFVHGLH